MLLHNGQQTIPVTSPGSLYDSLPFVTSFIQYTGKGSVREYARNRSMIAISIL